MQVQLYSSSSSSYGSGSRSAGLYGHRSRSPPSALGANGGGASQPRNLTGIYLGLEGNIKPPRPKTCVPPLARSRGSSRMKTPTEEQRYPYWSILEYLLNASGSPGLRGDHNANANQWTLTLDDRKVESLRVKEENRGFSGYPLKKRRPISPSMPRDRASSPPFSASSPPHSYHHHHHHLGCESAPLGQHSATATATAAAAAAAQPSHDTHGPHECQIRRWGPGKRNDPANIYSLLRPNPRQFTAVANSGVTRSERLDDWRGQGKRRQEEEEDPAEEVLMKPTTIVRELGRMNSEDLAGLEECFRRVCKGSVEVLYSLLPGRKNPHPRRDNTGFTVRSYRNPKQAEILAEFREDTEAQGGRPRTVPLRRPLVPQPYFFRHSTTHPGAAAISALQRPSEAAGSGYFHSTSRILAAPGAGTLSTTLAHRRHSYLASALTAPTLHPRGGPPALQQRQPRTTTTPYSEADLDPVLQESKGFGPELITARIGIDLTGEHYEDRGAAADDEGEGEITEAANAEGAPPISSSSFSSAAVTAGAASGRAAAVAASAGGKEADEEDPTSTATGLDPTAEWVTPDSSGPAPPRGEADLSPQLSHRERDRAAGSAPDGETLGDVGEEEEGQGGAAEGRGGAAMETGEKDSGDPALLSGDGDSEMLQQAHYGSEPEVRVTEEEQQVDDLTPSTTADSRPRPKLKASNSGADIMLGLETDEGKSAEVEIDTADQEELMPEAEVPKGRVRKASITEKVIKTKASEAMAAMIKEEAEMRQREFEKLLDEHAELVQEISRTPSSENLIQGERDH